MQLPFMAEYVVEHHIVGCSVDVGWFKLEGNPQPVYMAWIMPKVEKNGHKGTADPLYLDIARPQVDRDNMFALVGLEDVIVTEYRLQKQ
jgi:hypothetical protein